MARLKVATFNIEWMVLAFGGLWKKWRAPEIPRTFRGGVVGGVRHEPIADVHAMCRRIAGVIRDVGAHVVGIQEGPPLAAQLEAFVDQFLGGDYVVFHSNARWQSICALVHRSVASRVTAWQPALPVLPTFWGRVPYYPWGLIESAARKQHRLDRHPLLLSFRARRGAELRLMVLHTKSKFSALQRAEQWDPTRDRAAVLDALNARAKLSAEVFRIRDFLDRQLGAGHEEVAVLGDLNDGPFAELFEREFLIHNIVDELVGSLLYPDRHLRHAMTPATLRTAATTRFPDPLQGGALVEELIDHVLVSPAIWQETGRFRLVPDSCQVELAAYERHSDDAEGARRRERRPSDHKPVSAVFEY